MRLTNACPRGAKQKNAPARVGLAQARTLTQETSFSDVSVAGWPALQRSIRNLKVAGDTLVF
jgi:hypothetical protein